MHIGIFCKQFLGEGGFPREWRRFALELAKLGVNITVFCFSSNKPPCIHENIKIHTFIKENKNPFNIPKPLLEKIEEYKNQIDVFEIVATYEAENITLMKFLRTHHIPYIIAPLGHLAPRIIRNDWWKKVPFIHLLLKPCLKHASGIHTFSQLENTWIKKLTNSPIIQACHGSYIEDIPDNLEFDYLKKTLSLPDNYKIILYLGRLDITGKGLYELLDGFKIAHSLNENISLVLIGPDENDNKQKLLKRVREREIQGVHILDPIYDHNKFNALASADIFIYPSRYDILPRAVREALALGCPCIVSVETHFGELLQKYNAGSICDVSAISIANNISTLLSNGTELHSMKKNAVELCTNELNWFTEAEKLNHGIKNILSQSRT